MQSWAVLIKMNDLPVFAARQDPCQNEGILICDLKYSFSVDGGKKPRRRFARFTMIVRNRKRQKGRFNNLLNSSQFG